MSERVDLFGNPVAPTVEQGNLFDGGAGRPRATMRGAITPAEMTARRDDLGAPPAPIAGETPGELFPARPHRAEPELRVDRRWQARCWCGWTSEPLDTRAAADEAAAGHDIAANRE